MTFESGWLLDVCRQTDEMLLDSYAVSTGVPIGGAPRSSRNAGRIGLTDE